jgi:hypothetical protein
MAKYLLKTSLARGEITPLAGQRQDLELYRQAVERMFNWFVLKHGGARRRSGTRYRGAAKFANKLVKLISYTYSIGQSYVLEFGDLYMRVWVPAGAVLDAGLLAPYELVTPYTDVQAKQLQSAAYNDSMFIAHADHHPKVLTRLLSNDWTIADVDFKDGPYLPVNDNINAKVTVPVSPTDGVSMSLTWNVASNMSLGAGDVGRHVRVGLAGKWSWGKITAVTGPAAATVLIVSGAGGVAGDTNTWRLGAFYAGNYPASVAFFEDRLCWSGVPDSSRTVYGGYSYLPYTYSPTDKDGVVTDAHGFALEIGRSDPILWMKESSKLQIGTASGIRSLSGSSGAALTAKNVSQKLEVRVGAAPNVVPEQVGSSTVFAGRTARRLNNMYYDYQVNGLVAPELSIVSEHLFKFKVVDTAYQETPDSILWTCDARGKLTSATLEQAEEVRGFASHDVSGSVSSIAVMQPEDRDELWMAVTRTINSVQVQYIETLEQPYDEDLTAPADAFFVDCGGTYAGVSTGVITGATWLAGEEVELLADGARLPNTQVSAVGVIILPNGRKASKVQFGKSMPNAVVTLEAPSESDDGSLMGRRKRIFGAILKLLSTQGLRVGAKGKKLDLLTHRNAAALLGVALPLNTGKFRCAVDDSFEDEAQLEVRVEGPFPATLLALNIDVESEP